MGHLSDLVVEALFGHGGRTTAVPAVPAILGEYKVLPGLVPGRAPARSCCRRRAVRSAIFRTSLTVGPAEFSPAYATNNVSKTSRKNHQR
ncbi:hypothetical protein [Streptomyces sp. NPDC088816]|uniref:hypothetical protein n=1 Tax=unclassified Streptomyces TaxID=2593676 RepID=UPI00380785CF